MDHNHKIFHFSFYFTHRNNNNLREKAKARNRVRGCLRLLGKLVRQVQEKILPPLKIVSLL